MTTVPARTHLTVVPPTTHASVAASARADARITAIAAARHALNSAAETARVLRETLDGCHPADLPPTFLSDLPGLAHSIELAVMRMEIALDRGRVR